jgi:hypothetical protein
VIKIWDAIGSTESGFFDQILVLVVAFWGRDLGI